MTKNLYTRGIRNDFLSIVRKPTFPSLFPPVCVKYTNKVFSSLLQLHPRSLAALQQDVRRRDAATDGQVPGPAVLLADCCRPARWRVRGGEACYGSALLPYSLLRCSGPRKRKREGRGGGGAGGGGGGGDTRKRGTARLGVRGVYGVLRELWWRYGSLLTSLIWESKE